MRQIGFALALTALITGGVSHLSAQTCTAGTVTCTLTGTTKHTLFLNGRAVSGPYSTVTAAKVAAKALVAANPDSAVTFGPTYRQTAKYCQAVVVAPPPVVVPPPVAMPVARFTWSCPSLTCLLDATSSTGALSYAWEFGKSPDGFGVGSTATVTYAHDGERTVKLTVTGSGGSASVTQTLTVPPGSAPPADTPPPPPPADTPPPPVVIPPPLDTVRLLPPVNGRRLVGAERLATWQGMKDSNHFMWQNAVNFCALTNTSGARYGDGGQWCAVVAVVNNDAAAAAKVIAKLKGADLNAYGNEVRQSFIVSVFMLDMVRPWITAADVAVLTPIFDKWAAFSPGLRLDDTDALVGEGVGALLWDIYNGRNPGSRANIYGGMRLAVSMADGGQWMESSQYNTNTLQLLALGNVAYRAATGQDVVPGISTTLYQAGLVEALHVTPDLNAAVQWADDQWPREFTGRLYQRLAFLGSSPHPYAQGIVSALVAKYPAISGPGLMGFGLLIWRTDVAGQPVPAQITHVAPGLGHLFRRDGQTLSWAAAQNGVAADHSGTSSPSDVQVYRNGWLLTHPIAYYGLESSELVANGATYAGLSIFNDRKFAWSAEGNGWSAIAGISTGKYWAGGWSGQFLKHGHRVTVLATIAGEPVVIVRDSVDMVDPRSLQADLSSYYNQWTRDRIIEFDGKPASLWHMPMQPTVAGNRVSWTTANGTPVSLWLDGQTSVSVVSEEVAHPGGDVTGEEKVGKYQVRVRHAGVLWQVWGTGTPAVTRAGNTITVNGKAFTITSSGVTGG